MLDEVLKFAEKAHEGQYRKYRKEPYITHPVAVAAILESYATDKATIAAALLHDVIEDCNVTAEELAETFSQEVADLVLEVTWIKSPGSRATRKALELKHFEAASVRGQLIKVADSIHNVSTLIDDTALGYADEDFLEVYKKEKLELAKRLTKAPASLRHKLITLCST